MMIPLGDRILVKPTAPQDKKGLIVIPESAKSKPQEGEFVAVGSEVKWLKVGERVLFGKYSGIEVQIEEHPYLIVRELDVMVRL